MLSLFFYFYERLERQPVLSSLNYLYYDLKQNIQLNPSSREPRFGIVEIDEDSLSHFGRSPWPRKLMAETIENIFSRGAKKIVLDIVFAENSDEINDNALIEVIKKHKDQIIMGGYVNGTAITKSPEQRKCLEDFIFTKKNSSVTEFWRRQKPLHPTYESQINQIYADLLQNYLKKNSVTSIFEVSDIELNYLNTKKTLTTEFTELHSKCWDTRHPNIENLLIFAIFIYFSKKD